MPEPSRFAGGISDRVIVLLHHEEAGNSRIVRRVVRCHQSDKYGGAARSDSRSGCGPVDWRRHVFRRGACRHRHHAAQTSAIHKNNRRAVIDADGTAQPVLNTDDIACAKPGGWRLQVPPDDTDKLGLSWVVEMLLGALHKVSPFLAYACQLLRKPISRNDAWPGFTMMT